MSFNRRCSCVDINYHCTNRAGCIRKRDSRSASYDDSYVSPVMIDTTPVYSIPDDNRSCYSDSSCSSSDSSSSCSD